MISPLIHHSDTNWQCFQLVLITDKRGVTPEEKHKRKRLIKKKYYIAIVVIRPRIETQNVDLNVLLTCLADINQADKAYWKHTFRFPQNNRKEVKYCFLLKVSQP